MDALFMAEVKQAHVDARKETTGQKNTALDTIREISRLAEVSAREGLLALEDEARGRESSGLNDFLEYVSKCICDGLDGKEIQEMAMCRFYADGFRGWEALSALIALKGLLMIQEGEGKNSVEYALLSMAGTKDAEEYMHDRFKREYTPDTGAVESLCRGGIRLFDDDSAYTRVLLCDHIFKTMEDRHIQRWLRDLENTDLAAVMKAMSGDARRRVFSNTSVTAAAILVGYIRDMKHNGDRTLHSAERALRVLERLLENVEIDTERSGEYKEAMGIIHSDDGKRTDERKAARLEDMLLPS